MTKEKTTLFLIFVLIIVSMLYLPTVSAQDYWQWHLPEGSKFRLGKGRIDRGGQHVVQFSPDGTRLAVATVIGIWLYETQTYQEVDLFAGPSNWINNSVSFSPDGRTLASNHNGGVHLWDVSTGTHRAILTGHGVAYVSLSFSPDGRTLATGGRGEIRLWDVSTSTLRQTLENDSPSYEYNSVVFSPDGRTLAAGASGEIDLWDLSNSTHREIPISGGIQSLSFSPDGQTLASSGSEGIQLWDVPNGTLRKTLKNASSYYEVTRVSFSPDGRTLASSSGENIYLWNVSTATLRKTITSHGAVIAGVSFSPDGRTLVSGSSEGVHLWDVSTGMLRKTIKGHNTEVSNLRFSPDGQILASGNGRDIHLWDVSTGTLRKTVRGDTRKVSSMVFSPDGRTLATSGVDGIHLWNVSTGTLRKILDEHSEGVSSVAFSPDGRTLASSSGKNIHLWNISTGTLRKTIAGDKRAVLSVVFSPDGRMLVTGGGDGIDLWNLSAIENLDANSIDLRRDTPIPIHQSFLGDPYYIHSMAFSPDGRMLAAGGYNSFIELPTDNGNDGYSKDDGSCESIDDPWVNGIIGLWNVSTGTLRELSPGYTLNSVSSVSFSPNGRMLASGSGGIHLWDTSTSINRRTLTAPASCVTFSPDGRMLASGDRDGTILLWDLALIVGGLVELPPLTLEALTIPPETTLLQNYPNPFNPETWIPYQLAQFTHVSLHIYAANGTLIRTLFSCAEHEPGTYRSPDRAAYWDGKNDVGEPVASGIYFYTLTAGKFTSTRKMLIRK